MPDLEALQRALGVSFNKVALLEQSLVHRSYLNENPGFPLPSNERLEFLGDAVLGLIVAEKLYKDFPQLSEGEMTRLRASLVRQETLAKLAVLLKLGQYLYLGRGEEAGGGRSRPSNLARLLEAIVGAIFLDQGMVVARNLVLRWLDPWLMQIMNKDHDVDYKSQLQELIQASRHLTPVYRTLEVAGPDHARQFTVEVIAGEEVLGKGQGTSKQAAELEAARAALETIENMS